jgi:putative component of membrane protein insertase Oxa1/YidC/SpoIIIJ protein YidD
VKESGSLNLAQYILVILIRGYRVLSPAASFLFGPLAGCRFSPTCSEYALDAAGPEADWPVSSLGWMRA